MSAISQVFPPKPSFDENSLPSLANKTYIITGATAGVGLELAKILYSRDAKVYIAARNQDRIKNAIKAISASSTSKGALEPLLVDLSDLRTVSAAAKSFLQIGQDLHGLVLNAAVMTPPEGSKGAQGYDLQRTTNCLGGYLLAKSLEPALVKTAETARAGDVRVVWLSSFLSLNTPKNGMDWDEAADEPAFFKDAMENYMVTKVGNVFLADDTAKRLGEKGIISVSVNPGLMRTELQRHQPAIMSTIMGILLKGPKYGAYSELFGLSSPDITMDKNGALVIPWGRFGTIPAGIRTAMKDKSQGGNGIARRFVNWCDRETKAFQL